MPALVSVLRALEYVGKPALRESFRPDCCIAATRVAVKVLRNAGYWATPFPCQTNIFNKVYTDALERQERPWERSDYQQWLESSGAWSIGLGAEGGKTSNGGEGWGGHLIAILEKERVLVDLSLDQASRPQKGIVLPEAFIHQFDPQLLKGERIVFASPSGMVLTYQSLDNIRYLDSPDWNDYQRIKGIIRKVEKAIL